MANTLQSCATSTTRGALRTASRAQVFPLSWLLSGLQALLKKFSITYWRTPNCEHRAVALQHLWATGAEQPAGMLPHARHCQSVDLWLLDAFQPAAVCSLHTR